MGNQPQPLSFSIAQLNILDYLPAIYLTANSAKDTNCQQIQLYYIAVNSKRFKEYQFFSSTTEDGLNLLILDTYMATCWAVL